MLQHELSVAIELAWQACDIALEIYDRPYAFHEKPDHAGPVTEADLRINVFLSEALAEAFPGDSVVGEESDLSDLEALPHRRWILDPIDGTKDFLQKNGEFSVMIGLAVDGRSVLGVVAIPTKGLVYAGGDGIGAFVVDRAGLRRSLSVRGAQSSLAEAVFVNSRNHPDPGVLRVQEQFGTLHSYRHGSVGCKVAEILEGRADAYLNLQGHCHWWDACGPEALMASAGGVFVLGDGASIRYAGVDTRIRVPFFAAGVWMKEALVEAIQGLGQ